MRRATAEESLTHSWLASDDCLPQELLEEGEVNSEEEEDDDDEDDEGGCYDYDGVASGAHSATCYQNDFDSGMMVDGESIPILQGHPGPYPVHHQEAGNEDGRPISVKQPGVAESEIAAIAQHGGSASLPSSPRGLGVYNS